MRTEAMGTEAMRTEAMRTEHLLSTIRPSILCHSVWLGVSDTAVCLLQAS
jgi:hypothetical protein